MTTTTVEKSQKEVEIEKMWQSDDLLEQLVEKRDSEADLSSLERFFLWAKGEKPDRMPTGFLFSEWVVNHYGYNLKEALEDPSKHVDAVSSFLEDFEYDTVWAGIDTTVYEPEALGADIKFMENQGGAIKSHPVQTEEDIAELEERAANLDVSEAGRLNERIRFHELLVEEVGEDYPVFGVPFQPLPMATQVVGYQQLVKWIKEEPLLAHRVIEACTQTAIKFTTALKRTGVHAFIGIAAYNSVPQFTPEQLMEFDAPYLGRVIQSVSPVPYVHYWWGLNRLDADPESDHHWLRFLAREASTGTCVLTNLDPDPEEPPSDDLQAFRKFSNSRNLPYVVGVHEEVMADRTPDEVEERVKKYIDGIQPGIHGTIIPNTLPVDAPVENVRAFTDAIQKYGTHPVEMAIQE